jgi:hypothetical protein
LWYDISFSFHFLYVLINIHYIQIHLCPHVATLYSIVGMPAHQNAANIGGGTAVIGMTQDCNHLSRVRAKRHISDMKRRAEKKTTHRRCVEKLLRT